MRKVIFLFMAVLVSTGLVYAQSKFTSSGNLITQNRPVNGDFTKLSVSAGAEVLVKESSGYAVQVTLDDNLTDLLLTEVKGDRLEIKWKNNTTVRNYKLKVTVSMPAFGGASIAGSGTVSTLGKIKGTDNMDLSIAGSGNMRLHTDGGKIKSSIAGSGNIEMMGSSRSLDISIAGSGSFKGYEMKSAVANISISGSGDVETTLDGTLTASIAGSGSVYYKGRADVSLKTSGSGKVKKMD